VSAKGVKGFYLRTSIATERSYIGSPLQGNKLVTRKGFQSSIRKADYRGGKWEELSRKKGQGRACPQKMWRQE